MSKQIYLAGGCFWGTEHFMKQIKGVLFTETGFANGHTEHPTYKEVYTDTTGHAETVRIEYDPEAVSLQKLLKLYFLTIDPLSLNQQAHDIGTRYRTGIYYTDPADLPVIREVYEEEAGKYDQPLVVELEPLRCFYPAEDYHQDYLENNPEGYCHISPALMKIAREA